MGIIRFTHSDFGDHNPLQYIRESAAKNANLLRWSLELVEFDLEIKYTKGNENVVADSFCHECEVTALYVVFCECDSFRGVANCRYSLMNCVGLIRFDRVCEQLLISLVDVSPV